MKSRVEIPARQGRLQSMIRGRAKKKEGERDIPGLPMWLQKVFFTFTDESLLKPPPKDGTSVAGSSGIDGTFEAQNQMAPGPPHQGPGSGFIFSMYLLQKLLIALSNPLSINFKDFKNLRDSSEAFGHMLTLPVKHRDDDRTGNDT